MNVSIRRKYFELRNESFKLREAILNDEMSFEESLKIQDKQDKVYKKAIFYKKFIEASEKVKEVEYEK